MAPRTPVSETPTADKKPHGKPRPRPIVATLVVVALLAGMAMTFQLARGAHFQPQPGSESSQIGMPAATTSATVLPPTAPSTPSNVPHATATVAPLSADVRVTENQDVRPACVDTPVPYTVQLANSGDVAVTWQVIFPMAANTTALRPGGAFNMSSLDSPLSSSPYWGFATPTSGTVGPGQVASFTISPDWIMPCGGTTYHATVHLGFPAGGSEPDLPLTYAGTGPARYSNIVVTQNQDYSESCPSGTAPPQPYTVVIKNTGNYRANIYVLAVEQTPMGKPWVDVAFDPTSMWIEANSTMQLQLTPESWIACNGTTYHLKLYANTGQDTTQQFMLTDTVS